MNAWALYLLLRATVSSFSGFASVPVVRDDLVLHRQMLSDDELNAALAVSQASPGQLGSMW
jgi:chromate transporter